jgi:hypothetical protein
MCWASALIGTNGDASVADREIADIQAVTAADIQRVARRYLTPERGVTIRYLAADDAHPVTSRTPPSTRRCASPTWPRSVKSSTLLPEAERAKHARDRRRPCRPRPRPSPTSVWTTAACAGGAQERPAAGLGPSELRRRFGRRGGGQGRRGQP